ncbi:H-type lectin domain-containing protein [Gluconobacter cadivus]|uniref:Tail fiber protein n=1 Tax=Gluconobacter cadivus TaxID=2728101 RepID=A0ABR9YYY8_9PROT|nr:hypothetical protein [Gluconobacter cadivus]MBF0889769.1 hypothetical protein [Gluconobacter cadivus]
MTMLANFVLETASSPGVGDFVLNGAAADRRAFSQAFPNGGRVFYSADDGTQAEWGVGTLTIANPCTLVRSRVIGNTQNGTDLMRFSGGVQVYNEIPAEFLVQLDEDGAVSLKSLTVLSELLVPDVADWGSNQAVGAADARNKFVKQSWGFSNFGANQIYVGWRTDGSGLGIAVDQTDLGNVAFQSWVSQSYATTVQLNAALSSANSAQGTANSALAAANNANGNKLDITDGTATRMTVNYGAMRAQFQGDGNFVLYSGTTPVLSVSSSSISWNGHDFAFIDNLPTDPGEKIVMDVATGIASGGRVTFAVPFSDTPKVMAQNFGNGDVNCHAYAPDKTGFSLHINNGGTTDITYIAKGPK